MLTKERIFGQNRRKMWSQNTKNCVHGHKYSFLLKIHCSALIFLLSLCGCCWSGTGLALRWGNTAVLGSEEGPWHLLAQLRIKFHALQEAIPQGCKERHQVRVADESYTALSISLFFYCCSSTIVSISPPTLHLPTPAIPISHPRSYPTLVLAMCPLYMFLDNPSPFPLLYPPPPL